MNKQRFVLLVFFMLAMVCSQLQWLSHASIAIVSNDYFSDQFIYSWMNIDLLALVYMIVFLILSFPASYVIDTFGAKKALVFSSALMLLASVIKAMFFQSFIIILIAQIGLAIAQPFVLNAITSVTMHYFKSNERAICAGLLVFSQYIGMLLALTLAPIFIQENISLQVLLWGYALVGIFAFFGLSLSFPVSKTPFENVVHDRLSFKVGFKLFLASKDMLILLILFSIGLGVVNAIMTLIDAITFNMQLDKHAGNIGAVIIIGGMLGSIVLSVISDKLLMRKQVIVTSLLLLIPFLFLFTFNGVLFDQISTKINVAYVSSFFLGFFIMGVGPVGFQYAAEKTAPAPESVSQGFLLWAGQISGILLVVIMSIVSAEFMTVILQGLTGLVFIAFILSLFLQEVKFKLN